MKNAMLRMAALSLCLFAGGASADPLVEWNFNGGTPGNTFVSSADTSGDIVATADGFGVTRYAEERPGGSGSSSVEFDGFGFLRVPDHPALSGYADETSALETLEIRAWINPAIPHSAPAQLVRKTDTGGYELFLIDENRVGFGVHGYGGSSTVLSLDADSEPLVLPWGEWAEVVGKWDGANGTISITVNGIETVTVANTTLVPRTTNYLGIGALIRTNNTTGQFFLGMIDDIQIFGTLGAVEPPAPLVEIARWNMEGETGTALGPIDGALDNYLGFLATPENLGATTSLTYVADPRPGSSGSTAANFSNLGATNENGAILIVPDHSSLTGHLNDGPGYEAYEVEMWIRPAETNRAQALFRKTDAAELGFFMMLQANGTILVRLVETGPIVVSRVSTTALAAGQWYHVRAGFNPNAVYLELNENYVETGRGLNPQNLVNTNTNLGIGGLVRVGNTSKGQYFNGLMDELILRAAVVDETSLEVPTVPGEASDWLFAY